MRQRQRKRTIKPAVARVLFISGCTLRFCKEQKRGIGRAQEEDRGERGLEEGEEPGGRGRTKEEREREDPGGEGRTEEEGEDTERGPYTQKENRRGEQRRRQSMHFAETCSTWVCPEGLYG